jgi:MFS family permease
MSSQDTFPSDVSRKDGAFESTAREIAEFVISVIILPVMLLLAKPRSIAVSSLTGNYRPLPSPFLLAVVTGIALSGVAVQLLAAITGDLAPDMRSLFNGAMSWYEAIGKNSMAAVLVAIPYLCILWVLAGGLSIAMMRGWRSAEPLWAAISLSLAALVEVTLIAMLINYASGRADGEAGRVATGLLLMIVASAIFIYTLILAVKLIRLLFVLRKEHGSPLIGAFLGGAFALTIITITGLFGTAMATATYYAGYSETYYDPAREAVMTDAAGVSSSYNEEIARLEAIPNRDTDQDIALAGALNSRCWAAATNVTDPEQLRAARADCDRSLALRPDDPNTLDSRGLVNIGLGDFGAAYRDYNAAVEIYEASDEVTRFSLIADSFYYGRGLARAELGQAQAGEADMRMAERMDASVAERFAGYASVAQLLAVKAAQGAATEATPAPQAAPAE